MKFILIFLLILLQFNPGQSASASEKEKVITLDVTNAVLNSSYGRLSKNVYSVIFKRLGYKLEILAFPPERLALRTKSGKIDGELIRMSKYGLNRAYLKKVEESCKNGNNLLPPIIEAVKAGATMGEIVITMKNEFGEWNETSVF